MRADVFIALFVVILNVHKMKIINKSRYELPKYETKWAAGMDIKANIEEPITFGMLERVIVPTGLFVEVPRGYELQVRPRSGLAAKFGVTVLNSPGTIDSDFRNEIKVILVNLSKDAFTINPGDRIAQLVFASVESATWEETDILSESERTGGFGSTGTDGRKVNG